MMELNAILTCISAFRCSWDSDCLNFCETEFRAPRQVTRRLCVASAGDAVDVIGLFSGTIHGK